MWSSRGFHLSQQAADREHPFGHGRAEAVSTLVIAILLILAGVELGRSAVTRLITPEPVLFSWPILGLLLLTLLIKEWLARFSEQLGVFLSSGSLKADAWHHRLDALSTGVVILALLLQLWHVPHVDGIAGLIVSAMVVWTGFGIARETFDELLGRSPEPEQIEKLTGIVLQVPGAANVHEILVHEYGLSRFISLDIEVAYDLSLIEAHEIAEKVRAKISRECAAQVTVHVDPVNYDDPIRARIQQELEVLLGAGSSVAAFDLHVSQRHNRNAARLTLLFDPVVSPEERDTQAGLIEQQLLDRIGELHELDIDIRKRRHS